MRRDYVPKATGTRLRHDRIMDTHPLRTEGKFSVKTPVCSLNDRHKPGLLTNVIREEAIKDTTTRLTLPTVASGMKSIWASPILEQQGIDHYLWHKIFIFENHYQKFMYDRLGNTRCPGEGGQCNVNKGIGKLMPFTSDTPCYHVWWKHPNQFQYQRQWRSHGLHREGHFQSGKIQPTLRHSIYHDKPDRK